MAWAGIVKTTIIGPFFFDANVSGETYLQMLVDNVMPEIHRKGFDTMEICYMHDGAPAHITRDVRQCLDENFLQWIGRGEGERKLLPWPPRSPDLTMLDFYLWGVLQHQVHLEETNSIDELIDTVVQKSLEVTEETLIRVQRNLIKRLKKCIEVNGELFEHLLKH